MLHRSAILGLTALTKRSSLAVLRSVSCHHALKTKNVIGTGLNFPVGVTHAPGDNCRLFVIE